MLKKKKPTKLKTQRIIAVLDLPTAALERFADLGDVARWLAGEVNDSDGLGPDNVAVYAGIDDLVEDIGEGAEAVHTTLTYDNDEADEDEDTSTDEEE